MYFSLFCLPFYVCVYICMYVVTTIKWSPAKNICFILDRYIFVRWFIFPVLSVIPVFLLTSYIMRINRKVTSHLEISTARLVTYIMSFLLHGSWGPSRTRHALAWLQIIRIPVQPIVGKITCYVHQLPGVTLQSIVQVIYRCRPKATTIITGNNGIKCRISWWGGLDIYLHFSPSFSHILQSITSQREKIEESFSHTFKMLWYYAHLMTLTLSLLQI
jgi:hypothetical protein